jgi:D-3-phosphoglycerate dehydrogenase
LIGRPQLALMKPSAVLINTSRGDVVDQSALLDALRDRRIGAAALDVVSDERTLGQKVHPLVEFARHDDRLLLTPHVGGCTVEAQRKAFLQTARLLQAGWSEIAALRCHHV